MHQMADNIIQQLTAMPDTRKVQVDLAAIADQTAFIEYYRWAALSWWGKVGLFTSLRALEMFYYIMSYVSSEVKDRLTLFTLETAGVDAGQKCIWMFQMPLLVKHVKTTSLLK